MSVEGQTSAGVDTTLVLPQEWRESRIAVVLPTYNEADNLPSVLARLISLPLPNLKVFVTDDNSPDGTGDLAERMAAEHRDGDRIVVVRRPGKEGLGRAYVHGMGAALDDGAGFVVQMDCDLSHDPVHIPEMLGVMLSTQAGVVIGSRYVASGSLATQWGWHRKLLSAWANFYVHAILGLRVRDVTAGYKLWRRETLLGIDLQAVRSNGYSFQVEMNYRATVKGYKVVEVPIHFSEREQGRSKMSFGTQLESAVVPFRLRLEQRRSSL